MDLTDSILYHFPDSDLDLSFSSSTSSHSLSLSSRSSSSLTSRLSTSSTTPSTAIPNCHPRPHRRHHNPNWSAIKTVTNLSSSSSLHIRHIKIIRLIGAGNLGRVFLCRLRDCDHADFALKVVDRDLLTSKKLSQVEMEARILSSLDHPFLPTLYAHLEVSHYTCLLMDYCCNGDLHSLLRKQPRHRFSVQAVRFFAAEVLLALEYLHAMGIVYRDLKPENILIRGDGHVMLSDFDLCFQSEVFPKLETRAQIKTRTGESCFNHRRKVQERITEFVAEPTEAYSRSCVGTHEYLSPELLAGTGHGNGVDWWAFGVLIYELLYGTTPFKGSSKESTLRNIASTRGGRFGAVEVEEEVGMAEARDLIEKLLVKDPRRRLGCVRGATDIKRHPFFSGIKWALMRTYQAPEVGGMRMRQRKSRVDGKCSTPVRRRPWLWKRVRNWLRMKKYGLNSNSNYYSYSYSCGN